jgi:flagellar biosynthesis protein FlhA
MSDSSGSVLKSILGERTEILVAVGVIAVIMMLIVPLPAVLLDILMAANLMLSLIIILIVLYSTSALDFSVFPTLLLVTTVFNLALNVSSTRLILSKGAEFDGKLVRAFGTFVVGSAGTEGLVIGLIIFIILIAVQFIVITKGATRVAEVAARFTLDSLPGKQMAIEAEYNSGALTEAEATKKKNDLQKETDFYGAMDGASKFVSGNVKVGILITAINIVGGLIVGMTIRGEPLDLALTNYISLTVGDGLVAQFPALLISTATGLIVTRAISDGTFGSDVSKQFSQQSRVYWIAALFLLGLSLIPGFPWYVLIPMALLVGYTAYRLSRRESRTREAEESAEKEAAPVGGPAEISPVVPLDAISLELGYGLIPLVDKDQGAELLDRITRIRREAALELGLVVPPIRIIDNMRLEPSQYCVKIKGVEVGTGTIRTGHYLAINPGHLPDELPGEKTFDPAFGLPAKWITEEYRERAEREGFTVVDNPSVIATHLTEVIKAHAYELIGRQEMQKILETLRSDYSAVVDEINKGLGLGEILKVMQRLLKEQVSIRNIVPILETLADYAPVSRDVSFLVEKCRQALGREICLRLADDKKVLRVLTLEPQLEQAIIDSRVDTTDGPVAALEPDYHRRWMNALTNGVRQIQDSGYFPVLLTSEPARILVKNSTKRELPDLSVLSVPEVGSSFKIEGLGEIRLDQEEKMVSNG